MAPNSSVLAWRIPGMVEPGGLLSMGSHRVGHNWSDLAAAMAPHSSILAWKTPWMEEPGRLQSMGSQKVRHDWATSLSLFSFMHWRRKWQPTLVFLPAKSQGWRSLVGCCLWGLTESDTTEVTSQQQPYLKFVKSSINIFIVKLINFICTVVTQNKQFVFSVSEISILFLVHF